MPGFVPDPSQDRVGVPLESESTVAPDA